jgi:hypothetical protein
MSGAPRASRRDWSGSAAAIALAACAQLQRREAMISLVLHSLRTAHPSRELRNLILPQDVSPIGAL